MSEKAQLILMAAYNKLMNERIFKASSILSNQSLSEDKGAFFKSIIKTLNHIMIGDILWLKRFYKELSSYESLLPLNDINQPANLDSILFQDMSAFMKERDRLDKMIINWCNELKENDINAPLKYTNFKGEVHNKKLGSLIQHVFLHQVHHRGQVTTLLSQEGIDFGETDLPEIIPEENQE